jgi:aldose 1-epimerase
MVPAETFTATNDQMIPTGEIRSLLDTPMDFTQPTRLGERIDADFEPLRQGQGYDHNYILPGEGLRLAARLKEPASGRIMEVRTTEPAVQVYTANHLKDPVGKRGRPYPRRSAICLETQHYPDSPNQPGFPSTVLQPGQLFDSTTEFKFLTE